MGVTSASCGSGRRGAAAEQTFATQLGELDPSDPEEATRTSDGRVPGRRGKATRQKLLDCTRSVLESGSYRDLKIVDIAREAGTSPATFYQYFPDVEAAIAALAQEMATEGAATLPALVREQNWKGKHAAASSEAVVRGFFALRAMPMRDWSAYADHVAGPVAAEAAVLRAAHDAGVPVLGICFGAQLLAQALGGSVEPAR